MELPDMFRLFTTSYFYVGRVADGRGLLAGPSLDGLLVVWFDPSGRLLGPEVVPLPSSAKARARGQPTDREEWQADADRWLTGIRFQSEPIDVHEFSVEEPIPDEEADTRCAKTIAVSRYPDWARPLLTAGLADPADPDVQRDLELLRRWEENGTFVLYWGDKDYHLNKHGGHSS